MLGEVEIAPLLGPDSSFVPGSEDYVSSRDALQILQVKRQTLYSYVSRGLIRRRAKPGHRTSYYNREDIHRLKSRSLARSGHGPAAASAMYWGEPVLQTSITEITPAGPRYREFLAVDLANNNRCFESVSEYLWTGILSSDEVRWNVELTPELLSTELGKIGPSDFHHILTQSIVLLAKTWSCDRRLRDRPCPASTVLHVMAGAFGFLGPQRAYIRIGDGESIAQGLARVLGIEVSSQNVQALNAALVLMADHELTTPTFVARISASAGCDLQTCILAGLQVHFGSEFGLCCDRLEALFDPRSRAIKSGPVARSPTSRRSTPGFDNPLYAHGDPRANFLLEVTSKLNDKRECVSKALQVITTHFPTVKSRLNLCEALVVLCRTLGLPNEAAGGLIALARSAGCIAHVLEQRAQNSIIRPRGKFVPSSVCKS
jgi:citrate synthase